MANTYVALSTTTVGSGGVASVSFTSIPQTYTDLVIKTSYRTNRNAAADTLRITYSSGTTYGEKIILFNGSSASNGGSSGGSTGIEGLWGTDASNTASTFGNSEMYIANYTGSTKKFSNDMSATENNGSNAYVALTAGISNSTSAITSITLTSNTASTISQYSTFTLYGIKNS